MTVVRRHRASITMCCSSNLAQLTAQVLRKNGVWVAFVQECLLANCHPNTQIPCLVGIVNVTMLLANSLMPISLARQTSLMHALLKLWIMHLLWTCWRVGSHANHGAQWALEKVSMTKKGVGIAWLASVRYANRALPRMAILENVQGLTYHPHNAI